MANCPTSRIFTMKKFRILLSLLAALSMSVPAFADQSYEARCAAGEYKDNIWLTAMFCDEKNGQAGFPAARPTGADVPKTAVYVSRKPRALSDVALDGAQRGLGLGILMSLPVILIIAFVAFRGWFRRFTAPRPEDKLFAAAASELDGGDVDKGVWARLYAKHGGDEAKTRAAYIRERAAALMAGAPTESVTGVSRPRSANAPPLAAFPAQQIEQAERPVPTAMKLVGAIFLTLLIYLLLQAVF